MKSLKDISWNPISANKNKAHEEILWESNLENAKKIPKKEDGRTLQRRQTKTSWIHKYLLSTLFIPINSPPFLLNSLSHACLCITSSKSTPTPDYFETTVFGTRAKGMKSHEEIPQRAKAWNIISKSHKKITIRHKPHTLLQQKGHGSTLSLPHSSTPPLYHLYITSSPPTHTSDWTLQSQ